MLPPLRADAPRPRARQRARSPSATATCAASIHSLNELNAELAGKDDQLAALVDSLGEGVPRVRLRGAEPRPRRRRPARARCGRRRDTLGKVERFADVLAPDRRRRCARRSRRSTAPTAQVTPLAEEATPILRDADPPVRARRAARSCARSSAPATNLADGDARPDARRSRSSTTSSTSPRYNPSGREGPTVAGRDEGFLFWLAWLQHNGAALFSSSDANGPFRPVTLGGTCTVLQELTGEQPAARTCSTSRRCSTRRSAGGDGLMQTSTPSLRQAAHDGAVRAVVLRPAAVPVADLRRPGAAQAEGLPLQGRVPRGGAARPRGRRARRRRERRQGRAKDARPARTATARSRRSSSTRATRRSRSDARGDPAPEDAARRDVRRADAGPPEAAGAIPDGGSLAGRAACKGTVQLDEIFQALDPKTRARSRAGSRSSRSAIARPRRRTSTTRSATCRRFADDGTDLLDRARRPERGRRSGWSATPASCSAR